MEQCKWQVVQGKHTRHLLPFVGSVLGSPCVILLKHRVHGEPKAFIMLSVHPVYVFCERKVAVVSDVYMPLSSPTSWLFSPLLLLLCVNHTPVLPTDDRAQQRGSWRASISGPKGTGIGLENSRTRGTRFSPTARPTGKSVLRIIPLGGTER